MKNDNYLSVKLTNINVQVSWSKIILNSGTCIQNITVTVPSRTSLKVCRVLTGKLFLNTDCLASNIISFGIFES